jgi:hypothetical protein
VRPVEHASLAAALPILDLDPQSIRRREDPQGSSDAPRRFHGPRLAHDVHAGKRLLAAVDLGDASDQGIESFRGRGRRREQRGGERKRERHGNSL